MINLTKQVAALLLMVFVSFDTAAQSGGTATLDDLKTEEFLLGGTLWERVSREVQERSIQCQKAFPNKVFCDCLSNRIPMILTITQYAFILTGSLAELQYDQLTEDEQKMIDITRAARESCALEITQ